MPEFFGGLREGLRQVTDRITGRARKPEENRFGTRWDYTQAAHEVAASRGEYQTFDGYRIIGRDSTINEGVYFIQGDPEVLLVDDSADGGWLKRNKEWLKNRIDSRSQNAARTEQLVLEETYELVRQLMPYDQKTVEGKHASFKSYTKIHLREYQGGGVCRHQALLCAYLLEQMGRIGYLRGDISIDRSSNDMYGHAWVRYITEQGRVIIIDPARDGGWLYLDQLNATDASRMFYERPDEVPDSILLAPELPTTRLAERWLRLVDYLRTSFRGSRPRTPRAPLSRATS